MFALPCVQGEQGQVRCDERPFFVADIGWVSGAWILPLWDSSEQALADNGCAVVLSTSNTENSSTADTIWQIYYIADTDAVGVNWTVTLVGQLYSESTVSAIQNVHWS